MENFDLTFAAPGVDESLERSENLCSNCCQNVAAHGSQICSECFAKDIELIKSSSEELEAGAEAIAEVFVEKTVLERVQVIRDAIAPLEQFIYGIERMLDCTNDLDQYEQHQLLHMVYNRVNKFRELSWDMYYTKK